MTRTRFVYGETSCFIKRLLIQYMYPIEKERSYALRILSSPVFCGGDAATVAASEKENHLGQALVPGGCGRPHYCIGRRSGAYPAEKHAGISLSGGGVPV